MTRIRSALVLGALVAIIGIAPAQAGGDSTAPYGGAVTARIADPLHGQDRGGWLAITLDCCEAHHYTGPRHADIVRIPAGHGKRH